MADSFSFLAIYKHASWQLCLERLLSSTPFLMLVLDCLLDLAALLLHLCVDEVVDWVLADLKVVTQSDFQTLLLRRVGYRSLC